MSISLSTPNRSNLLRALADASLKLDSVSQCSNLGHGDFHDGAGL